ncbi:unnamed protein product [Thlaspi arvense]|uniref:Phospholipid/glycerol acyltransferase domain-containing protein n=1 Tax=Thlaspi arvense TaxID=13288 RepID=A0AAU9RS78_THLAR|nr:unnamed protein product [Thlaspi arvense]
MTSYSIVSEFEGTILENADSFSYFMLVAFEASGFIRFTILLSLWPIIALLDVFSYKNVALKLMIFVATAGVRESKMELVARAVLPKFYMDDISMDTWRVFSSCKKRVVVTRMPRVMVARFAKEHLGADEVIGSELIVNAFGFVTGLIRETDIDQSILNRVADLFVDQRPHLGLGRPASTDSTTFLLLCEEQIHEPIHRNNRDQQLQLQPPKPVIFHYARFVKRPTPATALLILIWIPFGIILALIRMFFICTLPLWAIPYNIGCFRVILKGKPSTGNSGGLLYVCNHRTTLDTVLISYALRRSIPVIAKNMSPLYDLLTPIPIVRFTRIREVDAEMMKQALSKGDLVLCPEGTTCFQPFVLRFSAMFAELTDRIVPVAINCKLGFFQTPTRSWDGLDMIFLLMNPTLVFEVTFLDQLPLEATCSSGRSAYDVANHVQRILADTLGFQCTKYGRSDKYKTTY